MTVNHDAVSAFPISTPANQTNARNLCVKRIPYVLADADDPQQLVETDPSTGAVVIDIFYLGRLFHFDATDTTTAHDGTTCLVTSGGKRYKLATGTDVLAYSVLSRTNTPPGSPSVGDAYLVTSSPSGAWVGHTGDVAVYTARGWEFVDFATGRLLYVEGEDAYYRRESGGSWGVGMGANALSAGSVYPSHLLGGGDKVRWIVENQTTNTPPGTVTDGVAYIIGSSPTGAWLGDAGKIAHGEAGAWVVYTPAEGWRAYDKAQGSDYQFDGSAWTAATGRMKCVITEFTASGTFSKDTDSVLVEVTVVGGGGGKASSTTGGTSSFGSHCSATGGTGGLGGVSGSGGTGSGGDSNLTGRDGFLLSADVAPGAAAAVALGIYGTGAPAAATGSGSGGGGGAAIKTILSSSLSASETVTVGAKGDASAQDGVILVKEWILI